MNLSVAIITYNEERILEKTLSSISDIADEIVIVDSFSTDKTEEICRKFDKVKFIQRKFDGFGTQKNFALEQCSGNWILFIDADEIPDETTIESIKNILVSERHNFLVYNLKFENYIGQKHLRHGGWNGTYRPRLFKNGAARYTDDKVHESLITREQIGILPGKIHHFTYQDVTHYLQKMNSYSDLMAVKNFENGKSASPAKIIFIPIFTFIKNYFFKLGFLDGFAGFYVARIISYYTFMKYIKLYDFKKNKP